MSNLDDKAAVARHTTKALYEIWRAWAEMRGHKTKEWTDNDDVANHAFIDLVAPFLQKCEEKSWKPFPSRSLVGGNDAALQTHLREVARYLRTTSPHQDAVKPLPPPDAGNATKSRYCPICDNAGTLSSQGAGPEACPNANAPWHRKK